MYVCGWQATVFVGCGTIYVVPADHDMRLRGIRQVMEVFACKSLQLPWSVWQKERVELPAVVSLFYVNTGSEIIEMEHWFSVDFEPLTRADRLPNRQNIVVAMKIGVQLSAQRLRSTRYPT
jgi:hypothetical protein